MTISRLRMPAALMLIFLFVGLLAYHRALSSEFIMDDADRIARPTIQDGRVIFTLKPEYGQGLDAVLQGILPDRPVLMATVWLNSLLGGNRPAGYKLVNVLLHALNSWLLCLMLLKVARFFGREENTALALAVSLLFLVHPINNQAVNMVIQRGVLLAFLFGVLAIREGISYLETGRREKWLACVAFYFLGMLSKPIILPLPAILLLLAKLKGERAPVTGLAGAMLAVNLVPLLFYLGFGDNFFLANRDPQEWWRYGLTEFGVVFHYYRQLLLPVGFNAIYPISKVTSLWSVRPWPYLLGHLGLIWLGIRLLRTSRLVGGSILCFYLSLISESSFFPIPQVVEDHRMYFPLFFLCLGLYGATVQWAVGKRAGHVTLLLFLLVLPLGFLNHRRSEELGSYLSSVKTTALKYKHDDSANILYLWYLEALGEREEGLAQAGEFARLHPAVAEYHLYENLFRGGDAAADDIYLQLLDRGKFQLEDFSRVKFDEFVQGNLGSRAYGGLLGALVFYEQEHLLLFSQRPFLFSGGPIYKSLAIAYVRNLKSLDSAYSELNRVGLVNIYAWEIWREVLGELEKLEPRIMQERRLSGSVPLLTRHFLFQTGSLAAHAKPARSG